MKRRTLGIIISLVTMFSIIYFENVNTDSGLIGTYIDGEYANTIPSKDDGYVVEKIACDNDAVGEWDYSGWGLLVKNMTKKSKCNVYFKKGIRLADTITLVDIAGKCPTVNEDGTVNVTSAESENSLLCMAPDNYGESYYFRGNVQNNYVYFAGFYWRIVRINGDGSIRMIYDGTSAHENEEASGDRIIGNSVYNNILNDNAYAGYMYGTAGSSTYKETHANQNNSTIKNYVDTWYENNMKNFEIYLSDNIFCNDRTISKSIYNTGKGYFNDYTQYRWAYGPWNEREYGNNYVSINNCSKNDSFSISATKGNGSLKYGIGLISMDEVVLSGAWNNSNERFYLHNGNEIWTISASDFNLSHNFVGVRNILSDGTLNIKGGANVLANLGVKPVINLKPNSLELGDGTISNPYRLLV